MNTIKNVVETIIEQSTNPRSIVLCLGGDISFQSGAPTFQNISESLCDYYRLSKADLLPKKPDIFYEYVTNAVGRHDVIKTITKLYKDAQPNDLHYALAKSPVNIIVTTNFDTLLERAFQYENNAFDVLTIDSSIVKSEKNKIILKLSGTLEKPESLVLTRLDRKMVKKSHSELQSLIRSYLAHNLVLFIGFNLKTGLSDFYERFGLESKLLKNWIVFTEKTSSLDDSLWKSRGVKLIEVKNDELTPIIEGLSLRISKYESKLPTNKKKKKVFIGGETKNQHLLKSIERTLLGVGLSPILLMDEPSAGRTLSEKFSSLVKEADAAIVILESNEKSYFDSFGSNANVLFELGFLVGSLGRENVLVVQQGQQNLPAAFVSSSVLLYESQSVNVFNKRLKNWLSLV